MAEALKYTFCLILLKGFSEGVLITQWPEYVFKLTRTSVDMHCFQNDTDYDYMYWYRQLQGKEPVLIARYVAQNPTYEKGFENGFTVWGTERKKWSLTVDVKKDSDALYLCAASLAVGYHYSKAEFGNGTKLTVLDPNKTISTPTVTLLPPSPKELCNDPKKVTLVCLADDFYPDHITINWQKNGININHGVATDHTALQDPQTKFYNISSRLSVAKTDWEDLKNNFTCTVGFYDGKKYNFHQYTLKKPKAGVRVTMLSTVRFGYFLFLSKSLVYALFVAMLVWKCKPIKEKSLLRET
ncbi:M1-specific T cell receptor beta chain-like [Colossoma macropomum]|uniref:M1-specific T cell receptor beta chain-like n=1 Tax=Colossoma macropomum TaxID=42526 RepID=UPI001864AC0F|nr:M1-specific T cell receptor beta chain-like [Colossoma macropomum]